MNYPKLDDVALNYTESGEPPKPPKGEPYKGHRIRVCVLPHPAGGWIVDCVLTTGVDRGVVIEELVSSDLVVFETWEEANRTGIEYGKQIIDG